MGYNTIKDISPYAFAAVSGIISDADKEKFDRTIELSDGTSFSAPFFPEALTEEECEELIEQGYGIKWCNYDDDFWAGAVKACGGVDKMPTEGQIKKLDNHLCHYKGANGIDVELATEMGFTITGNSTAHFLVWLGEERSDNRSGFFTFSDILSTAYDTYRYQETTQALCFLGYGPNLCEIVKENFNIKSYDCEVTPQTVSTAATNGDLSGITPHIVFQNGLKMYIGLNYGDLSELSDAEEENDRKGFLVYMDVNGDSGEGKLWEDVFPFYLLKSGKILAGYREDTPSGGNNRDHLSVNVIYDSYTGDTREVKLLMSDANFRSAACATGYIKSAKYCGDKVQYDICKDVTHDCRMIVKEPIKIF